MTKIKVKVDDSTEREFREMVKKVLGDGKDKFDVAMEEAIKQWIQDKNRESL